MKKLAALVLMVVSMSMANSLFADKLTFPIPGQTLEKPLNPKVLGKAAQSALLRYNWKLLQNNPGELIAEFSKPGNNPISIKIKIVYNSDQYYFDYIESNNLDAGKMVNGVIHIHKKVRSWIANLNKLIAINYLNALSQRENAQAESGNGDPDGEQ